jgi:hypothetical protein
VEIKTRYWDGEKMHTDNASCGYCGSRNFNSDSKNMLYTGHSDWFEGDICRIKGEEDNSVFEIIFTNFAFRKKFPDWPADLAGKYNAIDEFDLEHYEVIGNIYENPELLELEE